MALSLRQKQTNCIVRMLNLNQQQTSTSGMAGGETEEVYKILVLDRLCRDILSPLIHVKDLRKHGITVFFSIEKERQTIPDVPAIYFVRPDSTNVQRIVADASRGLYEAFHLNFSSALPRPLLEDLAAETLKSDSIGRISKVFDQYLEFITLEDNMFSLAQESVYVQLNDPSSGESEIQAIIDRIVGGLFCVLVTLGIVPVIRCARGGPAEMVATALDARLREHLVSKNNVFAEGGNLGASHQRPALCLFDRNFELSVAVQHEWSYRPLVHELLGLKLNKVSVPTEASAGKGKGAASTVPYELDHSDSFWVANASSPFPKVAEEIEIQLSKYKQDVEEVNRKTGGRDDFDGQELIGNTKHLMNAVNSLPELTERKKVIDKHTNIATVLLGEIKERSLDSYCNLENDMLTKGGIEKSQLLSALKGKGTKADKLRLAIIYLLAMETTPQGDIEAIEAALRESEVDICAFQYVKKIKSLNISFSSATNSASRSNIVDWAEKLYGQSLGAVTAGVKNLLSGGRQLALTRTVEALMEGKPNPDIDSYLHFDPRSPKSSLATSNLWKGPFKEAIIFMIGGGNYIEYASLQELAQRQPPKHVIYDTTEVLNGIEFAEQLMMLGRKMGLGSSVHAQ